MPEIKTALKTYFTKLKLARLTFKKFKFLIRSSIRLKAWPAVFIELVGLLKPKCFNKRLYSGAFV